MEAQSALELAQSASFNVDALWVLMAAGMVFLMQVGFLCFEVGCVRPKSKTSVAIKNVIDWVMISLVFFVVGFGFMFGESDSPYIGNGFYFLEGLTDEGNG